MNHDRAETEQLKNIKQERKKKKAQHTLFVNDMLDQGQLRGEKKSQSDYEKALKVWPTLTRIVPVHSVRKGRLLVRL